MTYCCDELANDDFIEWSTAWTPSGWVIYEGATGEYSYPFIKYCPYCGTELKPPKEDV